jgi:hypothetical protein
MRMRMRMARWTFRLSLEEASGRPPLPGFPAGRDPLFNRPPPIGCRTVGITEKEEFDKKRRRKYIKNSMGLFDRSESFIMN